MKIKNWEHFQHFKDRTPPWVKLYRELLDDPDWHGLDGDSAKVLVMLWLVASEDKTMTGALPDARKLAFRMRITEKQLNQSLTKLSHWLEQDDISPISIRYQSDAPETETETETDVSQDKPARKKTIAHTIPDDFSPNDSCKSLAEELGISWEHELPKFRDHHLHKGTLGKDWNAGFRTWLNNSVKFGTAVKAQSGSWKDNPLYAGAI